MNDKVHVHFVPLLDAIHRLDEALMAIDPEVARALAQRARDGLANALHGRLPSGQRSVWVVEGSCGHMNVHASEPGNQVGSTCGTCGQYLAGATTRKVDVPGGV
ncbi:hypothetical protein [Polyangium sp. 6x1]|uniref:hypothetical protein n=1 Tax=Polyangium sp. 6x1 TaxID=3042689 RepID=UPI0024822F94|nr:hypothetical protein [Polyangium sp. 6x1]MDI1447280.1 hypothetical protein [Polyangium sp. 6x1]